MSSFLCDLALLALLVEILSVPYQIAVPIAFLFVTSIQHHITRSWVFPPSLRDYKNEYVRFIGIALITAAIVTLVTTLFAEYGGLNIYAARVIGAGAGGLWSFFANAHFNFRIFRKGMRADDLHTQS